MSDHVAEIADRRRGVTATTKARKRRHPRIVPAVHVLLIDQLLELALAGDGVVQVEASEFVLTRLRRHRQVGQEPRSEEHTSELQSLMRISYAVFCLKQKKT